MGSDENREIGRQAAPQDAHGPLKRDHPLDEAQKSYHTVLEQQITDAEQELARPAPALLLSSLTAGLDVSFGIYAVALVLTLAATFSRPVTELLAANAYALGFIFVVIGRSALFTEHTTSAVLPVLAGRASLARMLRLWVLVLAGNVAGVAIFAAAAVQLGPALHVIEPRVFGEIATPMIDKSTTVTLASAVAAGWLMGLMTWLVGAARESIAQIAIVWLTTILIALGKLHHSIAGSGEVLMGLFSGSGVTLADFGRFLLLAAVGNAIGGTTFVALLKFGHVTQSKGR